MKKLLVIFLIFLLVAAFLAPQITAEAGPSPVSESAPTWRILNPRPEKLDPALRSVLQRLKPTEMVTVIVTLRAQADLSQVQGNDHSTRERETVKKLKSVADLTQGRLKKLLNSRRGQKLVKNFEPLWILNGFSVTATSGVINELAEHLDVLSISADEVNVVPSASPALAAPETNISNLNAPALWNLGYTGQGIVVASLDSGVDLAHPDLASRWRGGTNSWFDPYGQHPTTPTDVSGHGTWTMGVILGGDAGGTTIGVAPNAQWISAKIFNDQGKSTATAIHQSFQWVLDPDGNPNTADGPRVVNNSWTYGYPGCNLEFEPDLASLRAAGILPIFAAGNGGPYAGSSYSPANNPSAFAVGMVDNSGLISYMSSRGPTSCGGSNSVFPKVVAPGVNIRTSDLFGNYYATTGTSLAAPHVVGGLALLLSAYPNLSAADQEILLLASAADLGAPGPDDIYGYGQVDLFGAFNSQAAAPTATAVPTATETPISLPATETPTALPATDTPTALPPTETATALPPTATPTALPPTATSTPTAVPPTAAPTATRTSPPPTPTRTPTATPLPAKLIHVGDLDRSAVLSGTKWNATVTIAVHTGTEQPLGSVTVTGVWSNGASGTTTCTTNSSGICAVTKTGLGSSVTGVTFTITKLTRSTYTYQASSNHDPDGESTGTVIVVSKP